VILVIGHIALLHQVGSNNPLGVDTDDDLTEFYPYFIYKDLFALLCYITVWGFFVFCEPNYFAHPDNYIAANPLVTPKHIVPEWYFLPFYAMLRAIPDKLGGLVCMGASIGILFFLPTVYKPV
jgi:ubiquinol-cytochrome c reductase cytochrome b/c1 subunit